MKFKFSCDGCNKNLTDVCTYSTQDGYFYITGYCEKCEEEDSVDLTDWLEQKENEDY